MFPLRLSLFSMEVCKWSIQIIMRVIFLFFVLLIFDSLCYGQEKKTHSFDFGLMNNKYNTIGHKEGLWVETIWPGCIAYISYHDGKRDGLSFTHLISANTLSWVDFSVTGDPQVMIDFSDGKGSLKTYPPGTVIGIDYCSINTEFSINKTDGSIFKPYYKAYSSLYYPDGRIKSEGFIVWDKEEDPEIDYRERGVWKYYDLEKGITYKQYSDEPANIQNQNKNSESSFVFGQEVNLYNSIGQKEGLWEESNLSGCVSYITYHNGKRNGLSFMRNLSTNTISWIEYSENGELKTLIRLSDGTDSTLLYPEGSVLSVHFGSINTEYCANNQDGTSYKPYYKAYSVFFYPDSRVKAAGYLVWDKDDAFEDSRRYGVWKHFDEEGEMVLVDN